jgi:hypothetical protein
MGKRDDLENEIAALEAQLRERKDSLPAHSVRPHQMLAIEELETAIEEKRKKLDELRKENLR